MIKSSDNNLNNAYRIIKVLSNQDYLAINQQDNYFIFSSTQTILASNQHLQTQSNLIQSHYLYLLLHKQIIRMNNFHYYVFQIGKKNIIWARSLEPEFFVKESKKFEVIKHAVNDLLKDVLWMKFDDINNYLDIRNFWLINGKLHILLLKRQNTIKLSIKRSQNHKKSLNNSNLIQLINNQRKLMKQFAIILWQIFNHKQYKQNSPKDLSTFINNFLYKIIKKQLQYQQMKEILVIQQQKLINKTIDVKWHKSYKGRQLFLLNDKSKSQSVCQNRSLYRISKNKLSINKNSSIQSKGSVKINSNSYIIKKRDNNFISKYKSHLTSITLANQKISRQTNSQQNKVKKRFSRIDKQDQTNYKRWMTRHRSLQLDEKLQKQSKSAKQKYLQTISLQNDKPSDKLNQLSKQDQMKARLIQKLKQYKQKRIKILNNQSIISIIKTHSSTQNKTNLQNKSQQIIQQPTIIKNTNQSFYLPINSIFKIQNNDQNDFQQIKQLNNNKQKQKQIIKQQQKQKQKQIKRQQLQSRQFNRQIDQHHQEYEQLQIIQFPQMQNKININKKKEVNVQNNNLNQQKIKQMNNNYNLVKNKKKMMILNQINEQIQEIKFDKKNELQKQQQKWPSLIIKDKKEDQIVQKSLIQKQQEQKQQQKQIITNQKQFKPPNSSQFFNIKYKNDFQQLQIKQKSQIQIKLNYFINFINILGDISLKSISNKSKLIGLQWKKQIFLLYERFCYQRLFFVKKMKNKMPIKIRNKQLKQQQLKDWYKTINYPTFLSKIQQQNINIIKTFNKISQSLIKQNKIQQKFMYYIKNRQKLINNQNKNLRIQLSKIIVISLSQNFDQIIAKKINNRDFIHYVKNVLFGLKIIAELDEVLEKKQWAKLQNYRQQHYSLKEIDDQLDKIFNAYFPQQRSEEQKTNQKSKKVTIQ